MAEDCRRITLLPKEFLSALDSYRRSTQGFLPCGEILNYQIQSDESVSIFVRTVYGKNVNELVLSYKLTELLPALVRFCAENNILLPEGGRRSVAKKADQIALMITNET